MSKLTQEELNTILDQHKLWITDNTKGAPAEISNKNLRGLDLSNRDLRNISIRTSDCQGANFYNSNLSNAHLEDNDFQGARLDYAKLNHAICDQSEFVAASCLNTNFSHASCKNVNFFRAAFDGSTSFENTDLTYADMEDTDCRDINFKNAVLNETSLLGTCLEKPFGGANIDGTALDKKTNNKYKVSSKNNIGM